MKIESAMLHVYDNSGEGVTLAEWDIPTPQGDVTLSELKRHALAQAEKAGIWCKDVQGLRLRRRPWSVDSYEDDKRVDVSFRFFRSDWAEVEVSYCLEGCAALNAAPSGEKK